MMKKLHILIPSLVATASMPLIGLVGCNPQPEIVTGFTFEYHDDKTAAITGYDGSDEELEIPSTIEQDGTTYTVTTIKSRALASKNFKTLHIPQTIVLLENRACAWSENLQSITIDGNDNLVLEDFAFYNCDRLVRVAINTAISSIGTSAFQACEKNKYVVLPPSIGEICNLAFAGNVNITDVSGPEGTPGFHFQGTSEEWKTISRGNEWHTINATMIKCSDETIDIDAE